MGARTYQKSEQIPSIPLLLTALMGRVSGLQALRERMRKSRLLMNSLKKFIPAKAAIHDRVSRGRD
jgi:hypothetical protein